MLKLPDYNYVSPTFTVSFKEGTRRKKERDIIITVVSKGKETQVTIPLVIFAMYLRDINMKFIWEGIQ